MNPHLVEPSLTRLSILSPWVGTEWVVDALGCEDNALRDLEQMVELVSRVIVDLGLKTVGSPQAHQFPFPGGITVLFMLPTASPVNRLTFNYTPVAVLAVLGSAGIWWIVSARHWFTGPKVQGSSEELAAMELELERLA